MQEKLATMLLLLSSVDSLLLVSHLQALVLKLLALYLKLMAHELCMQTLCLNVFYAIR